MIHAFNMSFCSLWHILPTKIQNFAQKVTAVGYVAYDLLQSIDLVASVR